MQAVGSGGLDLDPQLRTLMSTAKNDYNHRRLNVTKTFSTPFDTTTLPSYNLDDSSQYNIRFIDKLCEDDHHRLRSSLRLAQQQPTSIIQG